MTDNRSILFLTFSFICIWLIMDCILGKKYLYILLSKIFPFYSVESSEKLSDNENFVQTPSFIKTPAKGEEVGNKTFREVFGEQNKTGV